MTECAIASMVATACHKLCEGSLNTFIICFFTQLVFLFLVPQVDIFAHFYLNMEKLQTLLWLSFLVVANIEVCPGGGSRLCRWSSKCRHKFTYWTTDFKSRTEKVNENFLILHFLDRSLTVYRLVGNRADLCEEAIAEQY